VRAALLSLAFLLLLAAGEARGAGAKIVVLHQPEHGAEEELLTESLRIYTRDLGCEVRVEGTAPASPEDPILAQLQSTARATGVDFLLWVGARDGGVTTYYALDLVLADLRETPIGRGGASPAAEEVALKVRALVAGRRRRPPSATPAPASAASPGGSLTPTATADAAPEADAARERLAPESAPVDAEAPEAPGPGVPAPPATAVVARPTAPPAPDEGQRRPPRFALDAGFGVATPSDRTWARSGFVLDLSARLGSPSTNGSLWIYTEGALSTRPAASVRGFNLTFADTPLTAGALFRLRLSHGSVAFGSRTTLHIFDVTASTPAGRAASSRQYGLGLGGLARAEAAVGRHLGAFLQASVEGIVPNQDFTIGGQEAAGTGSALYGAVAGVSLSAP
jgi:hypothetical protein